METRNEGLSIGNCILHTMSIVIVQFLSLLHVVGTIVYQVTINREHISPHVYLSHVTTPEGITSLNNGGF